MDALEFSYKPSFSTIVTDDACHTISKYVTEYDCELQLDGRAIGTARATMYCGRMAQQHGVCCASLFDVDDDAEIVGKIASISLGNVNQNMLYINTVRIDPAFRGMRLGYAMLDYIIKFVGMASDGIAIQACPISDINGNNTTITIPDLIDYYTRFGFTQLNGSDYLAIKTRLYQNRSMSQLGVSFTRPALYSTKPPMFASHTVFPAGNA